MSVGGTATILAKGRGRRWLALLVAVISLLAPAVPSRAQPSTPDVSATVSDNEVEVGEPFTVELRAWGQGGRMPDDPQLYVPNGIDVRGPRIATQFETRFGTGMNNYMRQGIRATWQLVAERPGRYVIPAPTCVIDGERVSAGNTMSVRVVPSTGQKRRKPANDPFGFPAPFGWPGGRSPFSFDFGNLLDDEDDEDDASASQSGDSLVMNAEPQPYVFLRAIADKTDVVVGEQVTLSLYVYYRADFEMSDRHEPSLSDFLRVGLLTSPGAETPTRTRVGSHRYLVRLLDRVALFPLRAGSLHTGSLTARFTGARVGRGAERASNDVVVNVREPPKEGRPPGYRLGDVGSFRLSAEVKPRETEAGGSIAVLVRLQGIGNVPSSLDVPDRAGVEWLDPETRSDVTVTGGRVGGWRTFGYVVRVEEPGERYLGPISLPYWDPDRKAYEVARVDLGDITVRPSATPSPATSGSGSAPAEPEGAVDRLGKLGPPRLALRPFEPPKQGGIEPRTFWPLLAGPPLAVLLLGGLRRLARRLSERRAARRNDPGALTRRALREMSRATALEPKAAAAERALHLAIEAATGVKSRGVLLADLPERLCEAGLAPEVASECGVELERCAAVRFVPGADASTERELETQVKRVVRRLLATSNGAAKSKNGAPASKPPERSATLLLLSLAAATFAAATLLLPARLALAAPLDELFRAGTNALGEGDYDQAIAQLESLADQGTAHPDASYNRGLAYVERVRAGAERPGDLGRAAAAFEEALALRGSDRDAELALEAVRAEVARRGARRGKDVVSERPSLDRMIVGLGSEGGWGWAAIAASILLGIGLALRAWPGRFTRIASQVVGPVALLAIVVLTPLYLSARRLRLETRAGVVVVPELYLSDENGRSVEGAGVPQAAKVEVGERRGRLLHVRWGSREGWAALGTVRIIGAP